MTQPEAEELKPCREAFEKWYEKRYNNPPTKEGDAYWTRSQIIHWEIWQAAWQTRAPSQLETVGDIPSGMIKISKLIKDLQETFDRFGDTCVYIRNGVSWGAIALNRRDDDEKAIEQTVEQFSKSFKPEYREMAADVLREAISQGWSHKHAHPTPTQAVKGARIEPLPAFPDKSDPAAVEKFKSDCAWWVERNGKYMTAAKAESVSVEALKTYYDYKQEFGVTDYNRHEILERIVLILEGKKA